MSDFLSPIQAFDHPNTDLLQKEISACTEALGEYLTYAVFSPAMFAAEPLVPTNLANAFFCDRKPTQSIVGYALQIDEDMPLDSKARIDAILPLWNIGLGTSMYAISSLPDAFVAHHETPLTPSVEHAPPDLLVPTHRISVGHTFNALGLDEYTLFVTANDVPAARHLYAYVMARMRAREPLLLRTLVLSEEFRTLLQRAQCARDSLATQYAKAYNIVLKKDESTAESLLSDSDDGSIKSTQGDTGDLSVQTTMHYSIEQSTADAHGERFSIAQMRESRPARAFVVYNNCASLASIAGGALISNGLLEGWTHITTQGAAPIFNPLFLSMLPAITGYAHKTHTQKLAAARTSNARTKSLFATRITWHSDIGNAFLHTDADEQFYALTDPYTARWLKKLTNFDAALRPTMYQQQYSCRAAQLANISTLHASRAELNYLVQEPVVPQYLPIALSNEIVLDVIRNWDTCVRASGYKLPLHQVFAEVYQDARAANFLTIPTMCTDAAHEHASNAGLYIDSPRFALSSETGLQIRASSTDIAQSIISLDKSLIALIVQKKNDQ